MVAPRGIGRAPVSGFMGPKLFQLDLDQSELTFQSRILADQPAARPECSASATWKSRSKVKMPPRSTSKKRKPHRRQCLTLEDEGQLTLMSERGPGMPSRPSCPQAAGIGSIGHDVGPCRADLPPLPGQGRATGRPSSRKRFARPGEDQRRDFRPRQRSAAGRSARAAWQPLPALVEQRRTRAGKIGRQRN